MANDADRWIELWTEDGIQLPPDEPAHKGKSAILDANRQGIEETTFGEFVINTEEVQVAGDLAFARGEYSFSIDTGEGSDPIVIEGKYLTVFQRQSDGNWKIFRDVFNYNAP